MRSRRALGALGLAVVAALFAAFPAQAFGGQGSPTGGQFVPPSAPSCPPVSGSLTFCAYWNASSGTGFIQWIRITVFFAKPGQAAAPYSQAFPGGDTYECDYQPPPRTTLGSAQFCPAPSFPPSSSFNGTYSARTNAVGCETFGNCDSASDPKNPASGVASPPSLDYAVNVPPAAMDGPENGAIPLNPAAKPRVSTSRQGVIG